MIIGPDTIEFDDLDSADYNRRAKFKLVQKIALVREQINSM